MAERTSPDSPIKAAVGTAGPNVTEAFELLGNETRLAILLALWEAYDPYADEAPALSFSELRERVGMRDSGQFNYHLDQLVGSFVHDTGEGYVLRSAGESIVGSVIAGAGIKETTLDATEIDVPCEFCGAPTAVVYLDEHLVQACTQCEEIYDREGPLADIAEEFGRLLFVTDFDPAGMVDRTPREIYEAVVVSFNLRVAMHLAGVCTRCSGTVEATLRFCESHDTSAGAVCSNCGSRRAVEPQFMCTSCKHYSKPAPSYPLGFHPEVIDFYGDHGVKIGDLTDPESILRFDRLLRNQEAELVSTDPPRVRVTIHHEGDELEVIYDEQVNVNDATVRG